jgi:16S rRNA G966 N2-methylase RsmD
MIERHYPTVENIRKNVGMLGVEDVSEVVASNAFYWVEHELPPPAEAWLVLCSPPYRLYVERRADMISLVRTLQERAPLGSLIVVESDQRFAAGNLPDSDEWDVRRYPPAQVAIWVHRPEGS